MRTFLFLFSCYFLTIQANFNGFNIFPFNSTALIQPDTLNSLKTIALRGGQWIGVNFFLRQANSTSDEIHFDDRMPTHDVWTTFIEEVHKNNLKILLKPLIVCGEKCLFIDIQPTNVTKWFSSYIEIITNITDMANELQADALAVGLELTHLSNQNFTSYWRTVIQQIRQRNYRGLLTYCSIFYPIETNRIEFWDELDFIAMDFYLPLLNITVDEHLPSIQTMTRKFSAYFLSFKSWLYEQPTNISSKFLVLTEVGYPSSLAGLAIPYGDAPAQCLGNYTVNFTLQNMAFTALFQVLQNNSDLCKGAVIFWWDNPSTPDYYKDRDSNNWPCSWTVQGKPAECTIAQAFGGICPKNFALNKTISWISFFLVLVSFCYIYSKET